MKSKSIIVQSARIAKQVTIKDPYHQRAGKDETIACITARVFLKESASTWNGWKE